jgi:hypothetical protein
MNTGQKTKKPDSSSAESARGRTFSWARAGGGPLKSIKSQFRRVGLGIKKHSWTVFAILLATAVMEFNYYQARLTREYIRAFLVSAAQMNGEADALSAKLDQLNTKIDALSAKLDKPPPASAPAPQAKPKHSIFSKPW